METVPRGTSLDVLPPQSMNGYYMITGEYIPNLMRFELRLKMWDLGAPSSLRSSLQDTPVPNAGTGHSPSAGMCMQSTNTKVQRTNPISYRSDTLSATCLLIAAHFVSVKHAKSGIYTSKCLDS